MEKEISIAYTKNRDSWRAEPERELKTIDELKAIAEHITDICFVSGCGLGIVYSDGVKKYRQFEKLTPQLLEDIADAMLFGKVSNAKVWYCCLKYSIENRDCIGFWEKYKNTSAGPRFMAIVLGSKQLDTEEKKPQDKMDV